MTASRRIDRQHGRRQEPEAATSVQALRNTLRASIAEVLVDEYLRTEPTQRAHLHHQLVPLMQDYSLKEGISAAAWLRAGVAPEVLIAAGLRP